MNARAWLALMGNQRHWAGVCCQQGCKAREQCSIMLAASECAASRCSDTVTPLLTPSDSSCSQAAHAAWRQLTHPPTPNPQPPTPPHCSVRHNGMLRLHGPPLWCLTTSLLLCMKHMHAKDIVHRDIKPDNILVRSGLPIGVQLCCISAVLQACTARLLNPTQIPTSAPLSLPLPTPSDQDGAGRRRHRVFTTSMAGRRRHRPAVAPATARAGGAGRVSRREGVTHNLPGCGWPYNRCFGGQLRQAACACTTNPAQHSPLLALLPPSPCRLEQLEPHLGNIFAQTPEVHVKRALVPGSDSPAVGLVLFGLWLNIQSGISVCEWGQAGSGAGLPPACNLVAESEQSCCAMLCRFDSLPLPLSLPPQASRTRTSCLPCCSPTWRLAGCPSHRGPSRGASAPPASSTWWCVLFAVAGRFLGQSAAGAASPTPAQLLACVAAHSLLRTPTYDWPAVHCKLPESDASGWPEFCCFPAPQMLFLSTLTFALMMALDPAHRGTPVIHHRIMAAVVEVLLATKRVSERGWRIWGGAGWSRVRSARAARCGQVRSRASMPHLRQLGEVLSYLACFPKLLIDDTQASVSAGRARDCGAAGGPAGDVPVGGPRGGWVSKLRLRPDANALSACCTA